MAIPITMSGWLEKRGGQEATKGWKKRWCVLSDSMFRYFKTDSDSTPAGLIYAEDIQDISGDYEEAQKDITKHGFTFKIVTRGRTFIFNAASTAKREEWVSKIRDLIAMHTEVACVPPMKYATVEIFYGPRPGVRVNGEIGTELMVHLSGCAGKTLSDERGWFAEMATTHTTVLNLFSQHGWTMRTAIPCNSIPSNTNAAAHSDMLIFSKPLESLP